MRKVFGGVVVDNATIKEVYFVAVLNQDGTIEKLFEEDFDRKKTYGHDFIIETANVNLAEKLTADEIDWLRTVDAVEFQDLILSIDKE